jgi:hypothetical protein
MRARRAYIGVPSFRDGWGIARGAGMQCMWSEAEALGLPASRPAQPEDLKSGHRFFLPIMGLCSYYWFLC